MFDPTSSMRGPRIAFWSAIALLLMFITVVSIMSHNEHERDKHPKPSVTVTVTVNDCRLGPSDCGYADNGINGDQ
jgi:hypothetical protein